MRFSTELCMRLLKAICQCSNIALELCKYINETILAQKHDMVDVTRDLFIWQSSVVGGLVLLILLT